MLSKMAFSPHFICLTANGINCVDLKMTTKMACTGGIIIGLALLIIGCLSISGAIPCNTIGAGFMIGIGCLQLVIAPLLTIKNCLFNLILDCK